MTRTSSPRAAVRRGARRVSAAAAARYRAAVLEQSRWLPVYLTAVDAADVARRAVRNARRRPVDPTSSQWDGPDPAVPALSSAGLSAAGELSLVLTGPEPWLRTAGGVALVTGSDRIVLDGGVHDHAADRVRLCVPVPSFLAPGRWHVELLDRASTPLPGGSFRVIGSTGPTRSGDTDRARRLEIADGVLTLVRGPDGPPTVEHRVSTGIARLSVEWAPPPGTAPEILLLRPDGSPAARVAGAATSPHLLGATIDADALDTAGLSRDDRELTVAVPGPGGPVPLALGLDEYPALSAAPLHGRARLGRTSVQARYDRANRLQVRLNAAQP